MKQIKLKAQSQVPWWADVFGALADSARGGLFRGQSPFRGVLMPGCRRYLSGEQLPVLLFLNPNVCHIAGKTFRFSVRSNEGFGSLEANDGKIAGQIDSDHDLNRPSTSIAVMSAFEPIADIKIDE